MNIYVDNAATTKMSRTAIDAMIPYMDGIDYDKTQFPDCASCGHCHNE